MRLKSILYISLASISLLLFGTDACLAQSSDYVDALFLYQQGNPTEAARLLEKELASNPDNDAAHYYLASIYETDRRTVSAAQEHYKKAVELSPDNFWYKYNLALFYARTDRMELTTDLFEQLIEEYPKKSSLYLDVVNAYLSQNEIDKALETLTKIESLRGRSEILALTRIDLLQRKPDVGVDSLYRYLKDYYRDCQTPRLATILGDYYVSNFQDSLAMVYYDQAIEMDNDYTPAYFGKARVNQVLRQYDSFFKNISHFIKDPQIDSKGKAEFISQLMDSPQFVATFMEDMDNTVVDLLNTHPGDTTVYSLASGYYYSTGRSEYALELMRRSTDEFPRSIGTALEYAILIYYCQNWSMLSEVSTVMLQRFPNNIDFLQLRAIANSQEGNHKAAIEDHLAILHTNPKDSSVVISTNLSLGDLYYKIHDTKHSFQYYGKVLKLDPSNNPALNNYAYHLSTIGKKLKKARQMSRKTVESEPDNPTYLDTYAWILHLLGQDVEAKAIFKHAMLYGGKESKTILSHYAEVLESLGENDLADIYRKQAAGMEDEEE